MQIIFLALQFYKQKFDKKNKTIVKQMTQKIELYCMKTQIKPHFKMYINRFHDFII